MIPQRSERRRTSVRTLAALTLGAGLVLSGCSEDPLPQPSPVAEEINVPPALSAEQAQSVLERTGTLLQKADAAKDVAPLQPRAGEPAVSLRAAQYRVEQLTDGQRPVMPMTTAAQTLYVPLAEGFPSTLMSVTEVPEGANLPRLVAFQQNSAREPYKLWGFVELYPGVTVPALAAPEVGSATLAPDAGGLVANPQDVVARYAATLEDTDSEDAAHFTPKDADPFKQQHRRLEDELAPQLQAAGTASSEAGAGSNAPVAIQTADGGALVMGEVRTTELIQRTIPESKIDLSGNYVQFLEGDGAVRGTVRFDYLTLMAFYVPPEGAEDSTIQVLGAASTLVNPIRDDSTNPDQ